MTVDRDGASTVDVLAIGAHPDDVELGCAGTLAKLGQQHRSFAILHLTRGERGSRGTAEIRQREAQEAGRILGASEVAFLDLGDGGLRTDADAEDQLISVLRRLRPRLVLGPPPSDRHPDHARGHCLVRDCAFFSGLVKRGQGEPHRPSRVLNYMLHDPFPPTLVVDVSEQWSIKERALAAHSSQLHGARERDDETDDAKDPETTTWISSRVFWRAIEGRSRHYGMVIGCEHGEPFWSGTPLAVSDLMMLTTSKAV